MNRKFLKSISKTFKYLGHGGSRIVFALNKELVIKVPKDDFGIRQNETEFFIYLYSNPRFRKYLCPPVKYLSSRILIMRRAEPLDLEDEYFNSLMTFCDNKEFYQDVLDLSRFFMLLRNDVRATSSWGILDGRKVLIDYGCARK